MISGAFASLDRLGIAYDFRKGSRPSDDLPPGTEVDVMLERQRLTAVDTALRSSGFHPLKAAGGNRHRFYVAFGDGGWKKIDIKLAPAHPRRRVAPALGQALARLSALRPLGARRLGPVIAVLGPDGAGKGTVISALREQIPVGLSVLYMGSRPSHRSSRAERRPEREVGAIRESAFVFYRALHFWRLLLKAYLLSWAGQVVLCDRHPLEVLAIQPRTTRLGAGVERFVFRRLMPWPDLVIVLNAPGELLYARKGEESPVVLERWRRRYLDVFVPRGAVVISAVQPVERTVSEASAAVWSSLKERRSW
jgi:thymidylate kinase